MDCELVGLDDVPIAGRLDPDAAFGKRLIRDVGDLRAVRDEVQAIADRTSGQLVPP